MPAGQIKAGIACDGRKKRHIGSCSTGNEAGFEEAIRACSRVNGNASMRFEPSGARDVRDHAAQSWLPLRSQKAIRRVRPARREAGTKDGAGMESKEKRKEAIRKFKRSANRPSAPLPVRSTVSGRVLVGASRNLECTKNGFWFTLRNGSHN